MSRNLVIGALVAGVLVLGGGAFYVSNRNNGSSSGSQATNNKASSNPSFDALSPTDESYVATITTTDAEGKTSQASMEYDKQSGNVKYSATSNGETVSFVYTSDAYYVCQKDGTCIKYPNNGIGGGSAFDPTTYQYTGDELNGWKSTSSYQGEQSCPAGSCDVWQVEESGSKLTFYISDDKRISKVETVQSDGSKSSLTYDYKNVTVTQPANAQEIPSVGN